MSTATPWKNRQPLKLIINNRKLQIYPSFKTTNVDSIIAFVFGIKEENKQIISAVVNDKFLVKTRWNRRRLRDNDVVEIMDEYGLLEIPEKFLQYEIDHFD